MEMPRRRFKAHLSRDGGITWKKARATGWPITDIATKQKNGNLFGYVFAIDIGDVMIDIELPERMLKLILKDVAKKKLFDDNGGEEDD